ncbi:MAG TPA: Uma2 family endonuclease [Thermomicrobiales bacterium]|jgi:Uma2 family endonuclease
MATIIEEIRQPGDHPTDPFRYGWRYRQSFDAEGTLVIEQIPLTVEDLLHPQEGDQVTHRAEHQRRRRYLCDVFEGQLRHDPTAVVLDDVRVAWDVPDLGAHGPDIAVILGVRERKNWSTFDVTQEGVRPALLIEITSPETASIDRSVKLEEYEVAGVSLYVIVDGVSRRRDTTLRILAYELTPAGYRPASPNERGWFWLAPVGVWLGVMDGELACFDRDGRRLDDFVTQLDRADAAERRVSELEAEIQRLREERQ